MKNTKDMIASSFGAAAATYDVAARLQRLVADDLFAMAVDQVLVPPTSALDLGCGTGSMATRIIARWPEVKLTAFDISEQMLAVAKEKVSSAQLVAAQMLGVAKEKLPRAQLIAADASAPPFKPASFDVGISSMMLQWLGNPYAAFQGWTNYLKPGGTLFVALPVAGSLHQWQKLVFDCTGKTTLWKMPEAEPFKEVSDTWPVRDYPMQYPTAKDFLRSMKATGATTSNPDGDTLSIGEMRKVFDAAPEPFTATFRILFLSARAPR